MKILVCIKQVPDLESKFRIDESGTWYDTSDLAWRLNEYDKYAIEQAIRVKEQVQGAQVTVLSVGPDRVQEQIRRALAMGCDTGIHVVDEEVHLKSPYEIAAMISSYASDQNFELIFTGMQSQDRGSGQIGVLVGEMLCFSTLTTVVDFKLQEHELTVQRELEGGARETFALHLPAVITCQLGLNIPRYPTFPNLMKAKKKELTLLPSSELTDVYAQQESARTFLPEKTGDAIHLKGDASELAVELLELLKTKTTVVDNG